MHIEWNNNEAHVGPFHLVRDYDDGMDEWAVRVELVTTGECLRWSASGSQWEHALDRALRRMRDRSTVTWNLFVDAVRVAA